MFQFSTFAPYRLCIQRQVPRRVGCPIRKSQDQCSVTSSSGLIAGSYVLHRLLTPRHPPCALMARSRQPDAASTLVHAHPRSALSNRKSQNNELSDSATPTDATDHPRLPSASLSRRLGGQPFRSISSRQFLKTVATIPSPGFPTGLRTWFTQGWVSSAISGCQRVFRAASIRRRRLPLGDARSRPLVLSTVRRAG